MCQVWGILGCWGVVVVCLWANSIQSNSAHCCIPVMCIRHQVEKVYRFINDRHCWRSMRHRRDRNSSPQAANEAGDWILHQRWKPLRAVQTTWHVWLILMYRFTRFAYFLVSWSASWCVRCAARFFMVMCSIISSCLIAIHVVWLSGHFLNVKMSMPKQDVRLVEGQLGPRDSDDFLLSSSLVQGRQEVGRDDQEFLGFWKLLEKIGYGFGMFLWLLSCKFLRASRLSHESQRRMLETSRDPGEF